LSGRSTDRKVPYNEWVNLVWVCFLTLAIAAYWVYNPSLLSEIMRVIENAVSGEAIFFSDIIINFALLLIGFSALRYFVLMVLNINKRQFALVFSNLAYCLILAFFGYLFNSWFHQNLSTYYVTSVLLLVIGLYKVFHGVFNGLFRENQLDILVGDYGEVIFGIRILISSFLFMEDKFLVFRSFAVYLFEKLNLSPTEFEFVINFVAFMEVCLFVYLVTEFPIRLIFTRCKRCSMIFLKIGVVESSWDSEHASKHRHCPRCGAACF